MMETKQGIPDCITSGTPCNPASSSLQLECVEEILAQDFMSDLSMSKAPNPSFSSHPPGVSLIWPLGGIFLIRFGSSSLQVDPVGLGPHQFALESNRAGLFSPGAHINLESSWSGGREHWWKRLLHLLCEWFPDAIIYVCHAGSSPFVQLFVHIRADP